MTPTQEIADSYRSLHSLRSLGGMVADFLDVAEDFERMDWDASEEVLDAATYLINDLCSGKRWQHSEDVLTAAWFLSGAILVQASKDHPELLEGTGELLVHLSEWMSSTIHVHDILDTLEWLPWLPIAWSAIHPDVVEAMIDNATIRTTRSSERVIRTWEAWRKH